MKKNKKTIDPIYGDCRNVIPRKFNMIKAKQINQDSTGGKIGDVWHITRNNSGFCGLNTRTGKYYYIFASQLREAYYWQILSIE